MDILLNKLKIALQKPLPGLTAQYALAPVKRPVINIKDIAKDQYKPSAVLILLCENTSSFIPLIERFTYNGAHSGQISLPGGKYEEVDGSLLNTAVRECSEEIGISTNQIEIIGKLTSLFIPVSGFLIEPYVGFCKVKNPLLIPDKREVKSTLKLSTQSLLDSNILFNGEIEEGNYKIKAPYFLVDGNKVWGATAMILNEFKEILKK